MQKKIDDYNKLETKFVLYKEVSNKTLECTKKDCITLEKKFEQYKKNVHLSIENLINSMEKKSEILKVHVNLILKHYMESN